MDEGRVVRDTIHIERDSGELQVEGVMVPFVIADLEQTAKERISKGQEKGLREEAKASSPAPASRGTSRALHFPAAASRGKQSGSRAQPESNESSRPLPGASTAGQVPRVPPSTLTSQSPEAPASLQERHSAPRAHSELDCSHKK